MKESFDFEINLEAVPFRIDRFSREELMEMALNNAVSPSEEETEDTEIINEEPESDNLLPDSLIKNAEIMNEIISLNRIEAQTDSFYVDFSTYGSADTFFRKISESAELKRISAFLTTHNDEELKFHVNFFNNVIADIKSYRNHLNNENFSSGKVISFLNEKILEYILDNINISLSKKYARQEDSREKCRELLSLTHDFLSVTGYYTPPLLIEILQNYDDISDNPNIASFYNVETSEETYKAPLGTICNISPLPYCMRYMDDKGNIRTFVHKGKIITLSGGT